MAKFSRKIYINMDVQENENAKKQDYWLGGPIPTTNRFITLSEASMEEAGKQSSEPKPPPIFISGVHKHKTPNRVT
jgi:hypothetical protein